MSANKNETKSKKVTEVEENDLAYERVVLLFGTSADESLLTTVEEYLLKTYHLPVQQIDFKGLYEVSDDTLYMLALSDTEITTFFAQDKISSMNLAIIPHKQCPIAIQSYGINQDHFKAIDHVFKHSEATAIDLLECNGQKVLNRIIVGDFKGANRSCSASRNFIKKMFSCIIGLSKFSFQEYTITTAKDKSIHTAAMSIMLFDHNINGISHNFINDDLSIHDNKMHALVLAPTSIWIYFYYLFISYVFKKILKEKLPESIGVIASSSLKISSPQTISYKHDDTLKTAKTLHLKVNHNAIKLHLGKHLTDISREPINNEEKETVRVEGLPKGDNVKLLMDEPMPFFPIASEEDFKEIFKSLRQNAKLSSVYITLLILSTLLATTGLFQNSVPVIIGAMILAPLMNPIISFSMGVVRGEKELLKESTLTLFVGIIISLIFSCIYTFFTPLEILTDEMKSRLNPNILDLMVAIISGIAGAYAHAKSEVAKSLAGVAIAVALVPPLSVIGIGIGWGNSEIIFGSFLLFITNLAGMTLSAALTFLILGFSPVKRATRGIVWTSLFLIFITVPLVVSFNKVIQQHMIFKSLKSIGNLKVEGSVVNIRVLSVDLSKKKPLVYIETRSADVLKLRQLKIIKLKIDKIIKQPIIVNILTEVEL